MEPPVQPVLEMDFPEPLPALLALLHREAVVLGVGRLALVGGAVRDGLLHQRSAQRSSRSLPPLPDLDLVVEGDAAAMARSLQTCLGDQRLSRCVVHEAYGTAELVLDGILLDLATARRETYPAPGDNPVVEPGDLSSDLARRDFSVNAMAIVLGASSWSDALLDPHGGRSALAAGELSFLHTGSVADDPTRVIRAARYAARLGFVLDASGRAQVRNTLQAWPWPWRHGDPVGQAPPALSTRLRMELDRLIEREPWSEALHLLQTWGALELLDPALQLDRRWRRRLHRAGHLGVPLLPALLIGASDPVAVAQRLQLPQQQQHLLQQALDLMAWLEAGAPLADWSPADWTLALEGKGWSPQAVALTVAASHSCWRPLLRWWGRWRHVTSPQSARELIAAGWTPGPALGAELQRRRLQRLCAMR